MILAAVALFLYFYSKSGGNSRLVFGGVFEGFLLAFWIILDIAALWFSVNWMIIGAIVYVLCQAYRQYNREEFERSA